MTKQPTSETFVGVDKGSPDGDCTVKGYYDKDGVLRITEVEHTKPTTSDYQEVERRFYERFTYGGITGRACLQEESPLVILGFIRSELNRVREETIREERGSFVGILKSTPYSTPIDNSVSGFIDRVCTQLAKNNK